MSEVERLRHIVADLCEDMHAVLDELMEALEAAKRERDELREAVRAADDLNGRYAEPGDPLFAWRALPAVKRAMEAEADDADA